MRKTLKRALTAAWAVVVAFSAIVTNSVTVRADGWEADFSYVDEDWNPQVWGMADDGSQAEASTIVTGAGSYSMVIDVATALKEVGRTEAMGVTVFVIDIEIGVDNLLTQNYHLTELKLTVDGDDFPIDTSKVVTGDIEQKGKYRIEIYNVYGLTAIGGNYDETVSPFNPESFKASESIKVDFTLAETDEPAYEEGGNAIKYVGLSSGESVDIGGEENAESETTTYEANFETLADNVESGDMTTIAGQNSNALNMSQTIIIIGFAIIVIVLLAIIFSMLSAKKKMSEFDDDDY